MGEWLKDAFSRSSDGAVVRRSVFALSFLLGFALCFVSFWRDMPPNALTLALTMIGAATAAVTGGRFARAIERKGDGK